MVWGSTDETGVAQMGWGLGRGTGVAQESGSQEVGQKQQRNSANGLGLEGGTAVVQE
jgi:hypothetical protein